MQNEIRDELYQKLVSKLNMMGFVINLLVPAVILLLGYGFSTYVNTDFALDADALKMIGYALVFVSFAEITVALVMKRRLFSNLDKYLPEESDIKVRISVVIKMMMVIHILAATPAIYGMIYYVLGGDMQWFVFMIILNLIGYQLCRARRSDYESVKSVLLGRVVQ